MNYSLIRNCDIANGPGIRVSLFVSGCRRHCPGCFQPETWNFSYGQVFDWDAQSWIFSLLQPDYIDGLTILGGEPFEPENQRELVPFLWTIKKEFPKKTVWVYTGYTLEELRARVGAYGAATETLLSKIDILVDGPFVESKKNLGLKFCGSTNQRLIDLRKTEASEKIVLWEE